MAQHEAFRRPIVVVAALLAVLLSAWLVARALWNREGARSAWTAMSYYFDQNTGKLFEAPADSPAAIETGSGPFRGMPAGVRAHVFAYDDAPNPERFVGWIEAPPDAVPPESIEPGEKAGSDGETPVLIRRTTDARWVFADGAKGRAIVSAVQSQGGPGRQPTYCRPRSRPR
jgi:hypothetical protein